MANQDESPLSWATPLTFRISETARSRDGACRCGTRLPTGQICREVHPNATALRPIFGRRAFCSLVCLRACVRESIEMLDGSSLSADRAVCSDLRELIADLEEVWNGLERAYPTGSGTRGPRGVGPVVGGFFELRRA